MTLTPDQQDRAAGVLAAMACADALGAPHEFGPPLPDTTVLEMSGGGPFNWAPGEWTDDTQMATVVLDAAEHATAAGDHLLDHLDDIAAGWVSWSRTAADVGAQTSHVLNAAVNANQVNATGLTTAATALHARTGRTAGNGSLMRTAPVALAYLHDNTTRAHAARTISDLTHTDPDAGDACILWCAAIAHAVLTGDLDVRIGLPDLPADRRDLWATRIADAEHTPCSHYGSNGWVVQALQSAWSALTTGRQGTTPLPTAIATAVRGGGDTDTVAAIAGALAGATWGATAVPRAWLEVVHGWPGLDAATLGARGLGVAARS